MEADADDMNVTCPARPIVLRWEMPNGTFQEGKVVGLRLFKEGDIWYVALHFNLIRVLTVPLNTFTMMETEGEC